MKQFTNSDIILNKNGSIYHLGLKPDQIYPTIITVGDPERVDDVSKYFDSIDYMTSKREFKSVGGRIGNKSMMVLSTGIGTDNIDIVLNELALLVNYDLATGQPLAKPKSLNIIRLGTSGSVNPNIELNSTVYSRYAIASDSLFDFYNHSFDTISYLDKNLPVIGCSQKLEKQFYDYQPSITLTACGFYGPQFRSSNLTAKYSLADMGEITYKGNKVGNIEMETSAIYGLSGLLGFDSISINAILANRLTGEFSLEPHKIIDKMIKNALETLCL